MSKHHQGTILKICTLIFLLLAACFIPAGHAAKYAYDNLNRLVKVECDSGQIVEYQYDANGNMLKVTTAESLDTDSDTLDDAWEIEHFGDLSKDGTGDSDGDQLSDMEEFENNTDPNNSDTDGDTLPDKFEVDNSLNPADASDATKDPDGDNYTNVEEYNAGTDPNDAASMPSVNIATQEISLSPGWNLISFNVRPDDTTPESVFASVSNQLLKVKNITRSYDPALPPFLNTLTALQDGQGYWINVDQAVSLQITGVVINPSSPISLKAGWNLVAFTCQSPKPVADALVSISGVLVKVKDTTRSYDPALPLFLNTLTGMTPGSGYWINVSSDTELIYPNN